VSAAIFRLDDVEKLPLWAQVWMAARVARRAVLHLPVGTEASVMAALLETCDAIERCCFSGTRRRAPEADQKRMEGVKALKVGRDGRAVVEALYLAADAALAAEDSDSFGAADAACMGSSRRAMAWCAESPGMTPLGVGIFVAADLDQLEFACKEGGVGKYDVLNDLVRGRMAPVHAPREEERGTMRARSTMNEVR
jgi:hypothetical protein